SIPITRVASKRFAASARIPLPVPRSTIDQPGFQFRVSFSNSRSDIAVASCSQAPQAAPAARISYLVGARFFRERTTVRRCQICRADAPGKTMQATHKAHRCHLLRYGWTHIVRTALSGSLVSFILVGYAHGQEASAYQVKAAYLYNFAESAQWPPEILQDGTVPLVIGIFGGDEDFVDILRDMVAERTLGTHPI